MQSTKQTQGLILSYKKTYAFKKLWLDLKLSQAGENQNWIDVCEVPNEDDLSIDAGRSHQITPGILFFILLAHL
jgi:hypothetical protein